MPTAAPDYPPLLVAPRAAGLAVPHVPLEDLMAEPPEKWTPGRTSTYTWTPAAYARAYAATHGPVVVAPPMVPVDRALLARCEAARWPTVADHARAAAARAAAWPALAAVAAAGAIGSPAPALVLVGDREPAGRGLPFLARSGTWLLLTLRRLGYDEMRVLLCNSLNHRGQANDALIPLARAIAHYDPCWVALGREAEKRLRGMTIPCAYAHHPAHMSRHKHGEGLEGYAERLRAGGVPQGPGAPTGMVRCDVPPELPEVLRLPQLRTSRRGPQRVHSGADVIMERARVAYVTGAATNLLEAAKAAGANPRHVHAAANAGEWERERAAHLDRVREGAKEAAAKAEIKAMGAARQMFWAAATRSIQKVNARLANEPQFGSSPREAWVLLKGALVASEAVAPGVDAEVDALRALNVHELARRMAEVAEAQFGKDDLPPAA